MSVDFFLSCYGVANVVACSYFVTISSLFLQLKLGDGEDCPLNLYVRSRLYLVVVELRGAACCCSCISVL